MKLSIVVPAYNEALRIGNMLDAYLTYFSNPSLNVDFELNIVLNGCQDNTKQVVENISHDAIVLHELIEAGKGRAVIHGFKDAISRSPDIIGFVDADMSTKPADYFQLLQNLTHHDGVIASRYLPQSNVHPSRPRIKRWGSKYTYEQLARWLLNLKFHDMQCGAKLFKTSAVEAVVNQCQMHDWAFDLELLFLLQKKGLSIKEVPTTWHDMPGSKLRVFRDGMKMLLSVFKIHKLHHDTTIRR